MERFFFFVPNLGHTFWIAFQECLLYIISDLGILFFVFWVVCLLQGG